MTATGTATPLRPRGGYTPPLPKRGRRPPPGRLLGLRRTDMARVQVRMPLTGIVPAHPTAADYLAPVREWNGHTNYSYGTCMINAEANSAVQTWKIILGLDVTVKDEEIFRLYRLSGNPQFDPATGRDDNGCDPTVALAALVREGINLTMPDGSTELHKPLCYGEVLVPPYEDLHAVTAIFGGGVGAFALDKAQDVQTDTGLWDYSAGSPPWGGHAVLCGSYTSAAGEHERDESLITWMLKVGSTPGFINHQLYGLYAIVWEPLWTQRAFMEGVDRAELAAAFESVTGRAFPVPVPEPPPPPAPPEPPARQPDGLTLAYLRDERLVNWAARRHVGDNGYAAREFTRLRVAELGA